MVCILVRKTETETESVCVCERETATGETAREGVSGREGGREGER